MLVFLSRFFLHNCLTTNNIISIRILGSPAAGTLKTHSIFGGNYAAAAISSDLTDQVGFCHHRFDSINFARGHNEANKAS